MDDRSSIFREYYKEVSFIDRFASDDTGAVDVIIPVVHTNELWEANLRSIYREVPVRRLLIGDGGCIDDSIDIARNFPRVTVLDHRNYVSLGFSIRKMIEAVGSEWFLYLHSDVYLPKGWFDAMRAHQGEFDWFGCPMRHTVMVEYDVDYGARPWAGTQMGRRSAFDANLARIDDDYVYRQEDFVFSDIVKRGGGKEGKVSDTFHYHQTMRKPTPWSRRVKAVRIETEMSREEELRMLNMQGKGIVKYLEPDSEWAINDAVGSFRQLMELGVMNRTEVEDWVAQANPRWLPTLRKQFRSAQRVKRAERVLKAVGRFFRGK